MTTITTINSGDNISDSRTDINQNFANLNSYKIESSYLDTDTALAANSDVKIPSQKAVKTYIDTNGGVNASETARGIVEEATDAEILAATATGATGAKLFITPAKTRTSGLIKFGGTGADGALSITSGTTTISLGSAKVVIKNYTSISITGTGVLAFSNPHANGTIIILKSQGNVTITSSANPTVDLRSLGGSGGAEKVAGYFAYTSDGRTTKAGAGATGGTSLYATPTGQGTYAFNLASKNLVIAPGAGGQGGHTANGDNYGGGGGGALINSGTNGTTNTTGGGGDGGGAGGRGAGALLIECAGAYSASSVFNAVGANGSNGYANNGGGGGGGAGGMVIVLYNTLTSNTATYTVTGGTGGSPNGSGGTGGDGGAGASLVMQNTEFS